ncbi:rRNA-processing protein UTP23-like protein [Armadillidium vulgare]|nr:rRNA-processing protein UTP23-like protein [Armadillidium vulgare]
MNTKRVKRLNKTIDFYKRNFGFFSPYNILIDGTFCTAALESKINISEQLPKYLDSDVNIVTTRCIIMEVEKLSKIIKDLYGTWLIIKQFKIHQCGHTDDFKSATECIKSLLERKNPTRKGSYELNSLKEIKSKVLGEEEKFKKKKKRNREPNPLSCLKSKKEKISVEANPNSRRRRRRQKKEEDILTSINNVFGTEF